MNKESYNKERFKELVSKNPSGFLKAQVADKLGRKNKLRSFKVALNVLEILDNKKMSKATLAEKVGVTPQQVSKWLTGKSNMTLDTIEKLENALGHVLIEVCTIDFERDMRKKQFVRKDLKERIITISQTKHYVPASFSAYEEFSFAKRIQSKTHTTLKEAEDNLRPTGS